MWRFVCGLVVLGMSTGASAGHVLLTWEYPLEWQARTTYMLHSVTLQRGTPIATEHLLTVEVVTTRPVASAGVGPSALDFGLPLCDVFRTDFDGQPRPCDGRAWTVGAYQGAGTAVLQGTVTLQATVCLEPGEYTLTVIAVHDGQRSSESNLLDMDLTSTTSCTPPRAIQTPPAQTSTPAPAVVGGVVAVGTVAAQPPVPSLTGMVNLACVQWAIKGPCFCGPFDLCLTVEYWEPAFLVETVKRPGDTTIPLFGDVLHAVLSAAGVPAIGGGGAGNATGAGHTNIHFSDVHIFTYPQLLGGPCTSCAPRTLAPTIHYASEVDAASWRTAVAVPSPLDLVLHVGPWGRLYPRGGKVMTGSAPVASALAVVRALDIMRQPIGTPPNVDAHIVLQPGDAGTPACLQLAYPRQLPCFPAGTPNVLWETGTVSPSGRYSWVIWRKRNCCTSTSQLTCGITLLGGHGANACVLPQLPSVVP